MKAGRKEGRKGKGLKTKQARPTMKIEIREIRAEKEGTGDVLKVIRKR